MKSSSPLGLYLHVPFCVRKCAYCDFYSACDLSRRDAYIDALCRDLAQNACPRPLDTIYVGGGTPTTLSERHWRALLACVRAHYTILHDAEISVEANPESLTQECAIALRSLGVNRLSVGVQSLDDGVLRYAGRLHDAAGARQAVATACRVFDNVNADYMVGFPHQTPQSVARDLTELIDFGVTHLSVYALIVEPDTPLAARVALGNDLPDDDDTVALYDAACEVLSARGFERYEISNFARPGFRCRHNLNCWQYHDYLGFGCSAHSFFEGRRYAQTATVEAYCAGEGCIADEYAEGENVAKQQRFEMIMLGLRTADGLDVAAFEDRFAVRFATEYADVLADPVVAESCRLAQGRLTILPAYLYVSGGIMQKFLR